MMRKTLAATRYSLRAARYYGGVRTIAHISDIHFGREDFTVAAALERDLNERQPNLLIVSGDLTQRARVGQYKAAMAYLARLPKPQMLLAGNHDVPLYNLVRRFASPLGRFKRYATADLSPVYRDEEMVVVGLNTASRGSLRPRGFWKDGWVDLSAADRAAAVLRSAPAGGAKIVVTHHPFAPPHEEKAGDCVRNGDAVLPVLREAGAELLLAGHLHHAYHIEMAGGAISLQAGTAISTRRRGRANSYNWITIDRRTIGVQVREYDGARFATAAELQFQRSLHG